MNIQKVDESHGLVYPGMGESRGGGGSGMVVPDVSEPRFRARHAGMARPDQES